MDKLLNFINMGGYGIYVWSAYGLVASVLALQLFLPWKRWKNLNKKTKGSS